MNHPSNRLTTDFWVPNLFEFKGGIQVYLQDILRSLEDNSPNDDFRVFDKLDRAKPADQFQSEPFTFSFSGAIPKPLQTAHFSWNLVTAAFMRRPRLIICGHLNFAPVALWLHRLLNIPYWIVVYGIDAWNVQDPQKIAALNAAEKIISISGYTRDRLIQEQQLPAEKFSILPVTFDASRFAIGPKPDYLLKQYNLKPDQPIILTVARLADVQRYKGYDQILNALPKIRQIIPDIHYLLVGRGSDRPRIEHNIAQLNLQDCVTLTGFIPDDELCDHYNLCNVFAMPSKREGFGIVYLEAMACGKPALGGNQDGAVDALCEGKLGALVNPDDTDEIADTLIQILQTNYPNPLMYHPEKLRHAVIETYGFERFKTHVADLLNT